MNDNRKALGPVICIDPFNLEGMTIEELRQHSDMQMQELPNFLEDPVVRDIAESLFMLPTTGTS